jgi:7-keto-8-aminopelargonate synthetase-like enzyme
MGRHPLVVETMASSARPPWTGGGGTRNIAGNSHAVVEPEAEIADLHRKSSAPVFSSGYVPNEADLGTLGTVLPDCVIFSSGKNRASMISGIRHSRAEKRIFRHNNVNHLEFLLRQTAPDRPKLIVTIYFQPINYPTVPKGTERPRITPTPFHDDRLTWNLAGALREVWEQLGLPLTVGKERSAA